MPRVTPTELTDLLREATALDASDVHLAPGFPATYRVHGQLRSSGAALSGDQLHAMARALAAERIGDTLDQYKNLDCSVSVETDAGPSRFRANLYLAQGQWCACLRRIPNEIPTFAWLGFPQPLAEHLVSHNSGLVVITGVTGSGKSSTLAAMIALLRRQGDKRILSIEEPIEYLHPAGEGGLVTQREVGRDVDSFADGLKYGLRQDPDVIFVGEIRDRDTAQIALTAAETGHLILTTLHTRDAKGALTRLVDLFPYEAQEDARKQLAMSLRSVVSQHLLPGVEENEKRALAVEVMHVNQQVQVAIRAGKIESIDSAIQTGKKDGMLTLDEDLQRLVTEGQIGVETARRFAKDPNVIVGPSRKW